MRLPGGDCAVVDLEKLRKYCLSEHHLRGCHKARVFASVLGLVQEDAEILKQALLDSVVECDAALGEEDSYGRRHVVDFQMRGPKGLATVRSIWIVLSQERYPRLVTCYLL